MNTDSIKNWMRTDFWYIVALLIALVAVLWTAKTNLEIQNTCIQTCMELQPKTTDMPTPIYYVTSNKTGWDLYNNTLSNEITT